MLVSFLIGSWLSPRHCPPPILGLVERNPSFQSSKFSNYPDLTSLNEQLFQSHRSYTGHHGRAMPGDAVPVNGTGRLVLPQGEPVRPLLGRSDGIVSGEAAAPRRPGESADDEDGGRPWDDVSRGRGVDAASVDGAGAVQPFSMGCCWGAGWFFFGCWTAKRSPRVLVEVVRVILVVVFSDEWCFCSKKADAES